MRVLIMREQLRVASINDKIKENMLGYYEYIEKWLINFGFSQFKLVRVEIVRCRGQIEKALL